eukprot:scaffold38274_cov199-Amphora_coffeaeformis.AAC.2
MQSLASFLSPFAFCYVVVYEVKPHDGKDVRPQQRCAANIGGVRVPGHSLVGSNQSCNGSPVPGGS